MSAEQDSMRDDLQRLHSWLMKHAGTGPVAIVTGKNGDMDTVGSAIALAATHPNMLACGLHIGRVASRYVAKHQAPFRLLREDATSWPKQLKAAVVVDAAAPDQIGVGLPDVPVCVIDHHATDAWSLGEDDLQIKWDVRSTTEVVATYLEQHAPLLSLIHI